MKRFNLSENDLDEKISKLEDKVYNIFLGFIITFVSVGSFAFLIYVYIIL
jgi:hypothetical protein